MNVTIGNRNVILTDEQLTLYDEMSKLQRGVALASLGGADLGSAHRIGGGKSKSEKNRPTLAHEILSKPKVVEFMDTFKVDPAPDIAHVVVSRDQMLVDLSVIANATIYDVGDFSNVGRELMDINTGEMVPDQSILTVKHLDDIKPEHRGLIKSVKQGKHGIELVLHDAMVARKQISDMCGYNAPTKQEITGANGGPIKMANLDDDQLSDELARLGLDVDGL